MKMQWHWNLVAALWLCAFAPLASAQVLGAPAAPGPAPGAPLVYVTDFELDAANVKQDSNPVANAREHLGGGLLPRLRHRDPQQQADQDVAKLANALVNDLRAKGLDARRLPSGTPLPAQGWLVRGVFLSVDEGNSLRRAVVGFGSGASQIELAVAVDNLATQAPQPLYQVIDSESSHAKPGAGAAIALNPYVAAAKFVLARADDRKNVDRAAAEVADSVAARVKAAPQ
ncbi:DUF4410 domain-containing protein [Paraburkholderia acidiphila]|uniref:DUF4410 domain-containing protein n=1 Tax=Paraburkholderia acidiphila TaxID=2571747 RepID=A0A7Z2JDP8_9BURK|nr:DUF4410 domain-containing protein [Paraburkholderia acidiphila]QGZ59619.1 DUF4410 domain-containing protein [Paraburkholderia acidiphila]